MAPGHMHTDRVQYNLPGPGFGVTLTGNAYLDRYVRSRFPGNGDFSDLHILHFIGRPQDA